MPLTFSQLREANIRRAETAFQRSVNEWSPSDWATAVAGECGEACNLIKKLRRIADSPEAAVSEGNADVYEEVVRKVADELADLVHYTVLLAARLDIDLEAALVAKFNAVSERVGSDIAL